MKDFLTQIVKALVDNPEEVQVNAIEGSQTTVLELRVAKEDMGHGHWETGQNGQRYPVCIKCSFWKGWKKIHA